MAGESIGTAHVAVPPDGSATTGLSGYEISPQQRRIWLFQRHTNALYARVTAEIKGALDVAALKRAVDQIVARHEILRTGFRQAPGSTVPVQVIHEALPAMWHEIDLAGLGSEAQDGRIEEFLEATLCAPFSFERGSLFRVALLRLKADRHLLALCLPSLCADSAALQTLIRELVILYTGSPVTDDNPPLQYADLADWQIQILEGDGEAGHTFWRQQDLDVPNVTLPFEAAPDASEPFQTASVSVQLDTQVVERLQAAAASTENRLASLLAGCWQALLWRLSGVSDILIRHTTSGRSDEDLQSALGPLERALPIHVVVDASAPATRLWRRTNRAIVEAARWEHYWNWRDAEIDGSGASSVAESFGFRFEERMTHLAAGAIDVTIRSLTSCLEPFKLQLACLSSSEGIRLEFTYDTRRFQRADIQRLATYFQTLLAHALNQPDAPVASLPVLPTDERNRILVEWNQTQQEESGAHGTYGTNRTHGTVHHLFEQHAQLHPDAIALVCEDEQLTYGQLNQRANQLAHLLQARGVTPDSAVGLCLPRCADLIVGLMGILKSGGAYLPLDPTLPSERLRGMLHDSGARLCVSQSTLASHLDGESILLDRDAEALATGSVENPTSAVSGEHLVYVIYTSGSTGRPKGVGIEHRNLLNYVLGVGERLSLGVDATYATVSTVAADLGNTTLFGALCLGGCLHLIGTETAMDPQRWEEYFRRHRIDCLKIVPSHLWALLGSGSAGPEMLPTRVLVLGGEACSWELVARIRELSPSVRVLNHYGPTETTVGVLTCEVSAGMSASSVGSVTVPLGRPLPNSRVYVLNGFLEPVPAGVVGELYIGGAGGGRGYLNREELTRERFIADPFSSSTGSRLYRTGDLVRWLGDGRIEFVGRVDHQVKIRGYRIELGEIESVLLEHGGVREAVVIARDEGLGEKRLVGYVVCREGALDVSELREHLRSRLPEYMIPASILALGRLPLTSNGKVDRGALPSPEEVPGSGSVLGAQTAVEAVLVGIWEELLHRDRLGIDQNFFELGGHSLLATQVISRVRETFEVDVPLRALFDASTIASFAELLLADPETRPQIESMAEMLVSLSGLSEEELEAQLSDLQSGGAAL